jgi:hypothetical protein
MNPHEAEVDRVVYLRARIASAVETDLGDPMVLIEPVDGQGRAIEGAWTHWVQVKHLVSLEQARAALQRRARKCEASV